MDRIIRTCSRVALAAGLCAVALPAQADVPDSLSAYVRARAAGADGKAASAAASYATALAASPDNPVIAVRAYREALASGDMTLARSSAAVLVKAGIAPADTAVLAIGDAIARRDWASANSAADRMAKGPLDFMVGPVRAWIARDTGQAVSLDDATSRSPLSRRFTTETRALIALGDGKVAEGIVGLRSMLSADPGNLEVRVAAAQLLTGQGRKAEARALLSGEDRVLEALRADLGKGRKADAAFGVSRLFVQLAVDIASGDAAPLSIVLSRAALTLDPGYDRARLVLADALSLGGQDSAALSALSEIPAGSIYEGPARQARVTVLSRSGEDAAALAEARILASGKTADPEDVQRYADLLVGAGRFDEAARVYGEAMEQAGPKPGWVLYLQRGGALEQAGRWPEAREMLEKAVELAPHQAVALNYLGYSKLERGEDLAEVQRLLERAVTLAPEDWAITDSLGWAYVKSGDIARALPLLEAASRGEPADVTVQEHLGDAYWYAGRRYEARYAWRAAAVHAAGGDAERLAGKLATGLPAATR